MSDYEQGLRLVESLRDQLDGGNDEKSRACGINTILSGLNGCDYVTNTLDLSKYILQNRELIEECLSSGGYEKEVIPEALSILEEKGRLSSMMKLFKISRAPYEVSKWRGYKNTSQYQESLIVDDLENRYRQNKEDDELDDNKIVELLKILKEKSAYGIYNINTIFKDEGSFGSGFLKEHDVGMRPIYAGEIIFDNLIEEISELSQNERNIIVTMLLLIMDDYKKPSKLATQLNTFWRQYEKEEDAFFSMQKVVSKMKNKGTYIKFLALLSGKNELDIMYPVSDQMRLSLEENEKQERMGFSLPTKLSHLLSDYLQYEKLKEQGELLEGGLMSAQQPNISGENAQNAHKQLLTYMEKNNLQWWVSNIIPVRENRFLVGIKDIKCPNDEHFDYKKPNISLESHVEGIEVSSLEVRNDAPSWIKILGTSNEKLPPFENITCRIIENSPSDLRIILEQEN